ncbi:MAG: zf-HC2 domain-containing protein [Deltaproteobacteria bacterium]|nr:zf-HC2 domain-containing protein [Deltaproteobacteria bacterium]
MDCKKAAKMIVHNLEGSLDEKSRLALNKHLSGCESCRKEFEAFSGAWEKLALIEDIDPSTDFINRLDEKIKKKKRKPFFTLFPAKTALATIVLSCAVALFTMTGNKEMRMMETAMLEYDIEMIDNIELLMVIDDMDELDLIESM